MANYSTIGDADISTLEKVYGLSIASVTPLAGGMANSSFVAETSQGTVVISVLDNQDDAAARRLADTTVHMARKDIPTSQVMVRLDGDLLCDVAGRRGYVKRWLDGETHHVVAASRLRAAGRLLGRIHGVDPAGLDIPVGLRRLSEVHRDMLANFPNQEHAAWIRHRLRRLDRFFPPADDPRRGQWAPIHGDFNGPNIVVGPNGRLSIIDWETVTIDDPMLDCGMSLMSMGAIDGVLHQDRVELFLDGYRESGSPAVEELVSPAIEYAAVIVAFHRYRRHNIRFPNADRRDYYRTAVEFVERHFPNADYHDVRTEEVGCADRGREQVHRGEARAVPPRSGTAGCRRGVHPH